MDIVTRYKKINESFGKVLIYHLGIDAGFFTEYTYMLNAMLFCLQHKIQFKLYSDDANFRYKKGWTDYFLPFCEEVHEDFHHKYNKHRLPTWRKILKEANWKVAKWKLKCTVLNICGDIFALKSYHKRVLLNHQVNFNENTNFNIPELGINGSYLDAFKVMVNITWRLNDGVKEKVYKLINDLNLSENYVGCQIRGGDKVIETELLSSEYYFQVINEKQCLMKDIFVLTDDIRIFQMLQEKYPEVHWLTLCSSGEKGYVNNSFSSKMGELKLEQMVRFIASIEILMKASLFIGTITAGPSFFLLKLFYPNHFPIDCSPEEFEELANLRMVERCKIAESYLKNAK